MYKWFAIKRIIRGIVIYALLIFIFSLLFNQINETTTRSQLLEQVHMEAQGLRIDLVAPSKEHPSMTAALKNYLENQH